MCMHIHTHVNTQLCLKEFRRCPCGVMVKAMDYGIAVSEFELQSRYYVHFRTNTQLWVKYYHYCSSRGGGIE